MGVELRIREVGGKLSNEGKKTNTHFAECVSSKLMKNKRFNRNIFGDLPIFTFFSHFARFLPQKRVFKK